MRLPVKVIPPTTLTAGLLYLALWPVDINPVAWKSPPNPGYTGAFEVNHRLSALERLPLGDNHGPEAVAVDSRGRIHVSTREGRIVRLEPDGTDPRNWAETGGLPLGLAFDTAGNLIVADALRGLLAVDKGGSVKVLATECEGGAIGYANDVAVGPDGTIYFTDASTRFLPGPCGGTYEACVLDIMDRGGHGRLLEHNPATGATRTLLDGLQFANGLALGHDSTYLLVAETGNYRILRYWVGGADAGRVEPFLEALPGFPDNVSTGRKGRFWVALNAPRNALLDRFSERPSLRKLFCRIPAFLRPKARPYSHVIAVDSSGAVVENLQDPTGGYPKTSSVLETERFLFVGSLVAPELGRLSRDTGW